jgi:hypothetical protein
VQINFEEPVVGQLSGERFSEDLKRAKCFSQFVKFKRLKRFEI